MTDLTTGPAWAPLFVTDNKPGQVTKYSVTFAIPGGSVTVTSLFAEFSEPLKESRTAMDAPPWSQTTQELISTSEVDETPRLFRHRINCSARNTGPSTQVRR